MSRITAEPFRFSDYRALKVNVYFDYAEKHDSISLTFRCGNDELEVISTSVGQIRNHVIMKPVHEAQLYVDYCDSDSIQCIIGYYEGELLRFSDILIAEFQPRKQIESESPEIRSIPTVQTSFDKQLNSFMKSLSTLDSDWNVKLEHIYDVVLTVNKKGKNSIVASLGEVTDDLRASDYLFRIDPGVSTINFPIEIVSKIKDIVDDNSKRVAIFELVTPDFVKLQRFYKIPISNTILLSTIK